MDSQSMVRSSPTQGSLCSCVSPLTCQPIKLHQFLVIVQVGLLRIEEFHQARGEKLPVSLVVSLGSGTYPPKQLGSINAQQYLYFGTHWLNLIKQQSLHEIRNLAELLSNAVSYAVHYAVNSYML